MNSFLNRIAGINTRIKKKITDFLLPGGFYFSHKGYCPCCEQQVIFEAKNSWLRNHFLCTNCSSLPRERALMLTIEKYYPNWENLDIHESSPVNRGVSLKLKNKTKNYIGS